MNDKTPYVHNSTAELLAMPFLAHGSNAVVFHTIGLLMTNPLGATETDLANFTCLSLKTIHVTLATLLSNGFIEQTPLGGYRCSKYIAYKKPPAPTEPGMEKDSFSPNCYCTDLKEINVPSLEETTIIIGDAKKFLAEAGVVGSPLEELASKVPVHVAQEWAQWATVQRKKDADFGWGGIVVKALRANRNAHPPFMKPAELPRARKASIQGHLVQT